ncbi:arginase [Geomicrobium sp. JCM 19038]|nr:arginase [Geomicrobium sp. JCM 19038]
MNKAISIVGVPMDLGQSRRGVDMVQAQFGMQAQSNELRIYRTRLKTVEIF